MNVKPWPGYEMQAEPKREAAGLRATQKVLSPSESLMHVVNAINSRYSSSRPKRQRSVRYRYESVKDCTVNQLTHCVRVTPQATLAHTWAQASPATHVGDSRNATTSFPLIPHSNSPQV